MTDQIINRGEARWQATSYPTHNCFETSPCYTMSPFVVAKTCFICGRILAARERSFWRRLIGVFYDNI